MSKKKIVLILYGIFVLLILTGYVSSAGALISGFMLTLVFGNYYQQQKTKLISWFLKIAIVGLGFGMFITDTLQAGKAGFALTVFTIVSTLLLGFIITKALKIDTKLGFMLSSGTSICGGSAIAAVASVIKAQAKSISMALGIVFLLNAIALFIFPPIGRFLNLTQQQFGLWSAVAIHDTSSVVGAALDYGQEALKIATTVKLARALWIIPLSLFAMIIFKNKSGKIQIPWFIFLFIVAILINSYWHLPQQLTSTITWISQKILISTLLLIGTTLSVKDLKETGIKPLILGILLWLFISITSLWIIMKIV